MKKKKKKLFVRSSRLNCLVSAFRRFHGLCSLIERVLKENKTVIAGMGVTR